jgi:hypothetical protein
MAPRSGDWDTKGRFFWGLGINQSTNRSRAANIPPDFSIVKQTWSTLFSLLRIKCLYKFRALLTHLQDAKHKRHLVRWSGTPILVQPTDITRTPYTKCRLCRASWRWASNAWNMYRPLILTKLNKKRITFFYYTDILWCAVNKTFNPARFPCRNCIYLKFILI